MRRPLSRSSFQYILEAMQVINQLDTDHIPPTAQVIPLGNVLREDVVTTAVPREEILKNAPRREDDYILVKTVLE